MYCKPKHMQSIFKFFYIEMSINLKMQNKTFNMHIFQPPYIYIYIYIKIFGIQF
jgi:hypothetical protein